MAASSSLAVGGAWAFAVETRDADGYRSSLVSPVIAITTPAGSVDVGVFVATTVGVWTGTYTVMETGRYVAHVSTPEDALDLTAYVTGPVDASTFPDVDAVEDYLGNRAGNWTRADMQDALNAEASAQRDVCNVPAAYPDSLRQALLRRVQRNLSLRNLPLAIMTGDAEGGSMVLPGRDPEVRRFEGPYRKLNIG